MTCVQCGNPTCIGECGDITMVNYNVSSDERKMIEINLEEWKNCYAAFRGAFDTPLARRRFDDEFSEDARKRMRQINEKITGEIY
jgi:hypothetical protein